MKQQSFVRTPRRGLFGLTGLVLVGLAIVLLALPQPRADDPVVHVLDIDGPIGPAIKDFMVRGIEQAEEEGSRLVVLRMDTPGGLDASMRDMISKMLNADVPVATWVGPAGARAASAGTYMLYASHVAAMAPSTNLGAATPVQIGGGGNDEAEQPRSPLERARDALDDSAGESAEESAEEDQGSGEADGAEEAPEAESEPEPEPQSAPGSATERKVLEDASAYIRGLAERHGRNAEWAERAVREAVSLTASEALEINVIDLVAESLTELLEAVDGREVRMHDGTQVLETAGVRTVVIEQDWRSRFLGVITNPSLAYILLLVGIYGLILEGYNPGALVPGVIGGISLLLALYAFQILPVNYAGLALMVLGFALIAVELFVPSFGILGIGGVFAVVFGSIILMDTDVPGFAVNTGLIAAMGLAAALTFFVIIYLAARSHRNPRVSGTEALVGLKAESISDFDDGKGRVHVEGEDWSARGPESIRTGDRVEIEAVDGLVVQVRPADHSSHV
ncbi:NfeD family protein [Wenzhouxiangella limi]|uniref:Nodulation protein NfeD n=1 Tax=Wenzhouxiangella limi TaxID=2707351 RepID=A0A845V2R4_9GAMM|nr:nodulation protein NfeD [Wenzhouxiangella limi]NDY94295.1 nodulation protein NfeD [Wenzhouxiangella limi]